MVGCPPTFSDRQTLPDTGPSPVDAQYLSISTRAYITFDSTCRPGSLSVAPWVFTLNDLTFTPTSSAWLTPTILAIYGTQAPGPPGPSVVDYTPPPDVVRSSRLVPTSAFAGFPVTVVP